MIGSKEPEEELYPIGTDILVWSGYRATLNTSKMIKGSTGEYVDKTDSTIFGASEVYIPVSPKYSYARDANRIRNIVFYDANKAYISSTDYMSNYNAGPLRAFPSATRFIRVTLHANNNQGLKITRTA